MLEARDGGALAGSTVLVAPSGYHTLVTAERAIALVRSGNRPPLRPSADLLLTSIAISVGARAVAVVLSGFGNDGAAGATVIKRFEGWVIASDRLSSHEYAMPEAAILGELKRHLRDRGWSVRPSRHIQELAARIDRDAHALRTELGRSATVAELAQRAESTVEQVLEALQAATARHAVSLDQPRHDDPERRGLEVATDESGFAATENTMLLDSLMRDLTPRERQILNLRFRDDLTQSQIGDIVGVSQMHVSRIIRSVLQRLQAATTLKTAPTSSPPHLSVGPPLCPRRRL